MYILEMPKSRAWDFFEKVSAKQSQCNHCGGIVTTSGNTSNLFTHLKIHHFDLYAREFDKNRRTEGMYILLNFTLDLRISF